MPEFQVGDWVVYRPHLGGDAEDGEVRGFSESGLVYVLYRGDRTAKATHPDHLEPGMRGHVGGQPVLPYGGTRQPPNSGYAAGADTSRDRALRDDGDATTSKRQATVLSLLADRAVTGANGYATRIGQEYGVTWKELAFRQDWHHGQASGVLSVLHKSGRIARLTERRGRCFVYVLPEYVNGRDTQPHGRQPRKGEQPDTQLASDLVAAEAAIRRVRELHHRQPGPRLLGDCCGHDGLTWPCPTIRALVPR